MKKSIFSNQHKGVTQVHEKEGTFATNKAAENRAKARAGTESTA